MILATNNTTVESDFIKEVHPEKNFMISLLEFALLKLNMELNNRMKIQGTDGVSKCQLHEGVSIGAFMLTFCPWEQSDLDRSPSLKDWWCSVLDERLEFLKSKDWFNRGHDYSGIYKDTSGFWRLKTQKGIFVRSPPSPVADAVIENLRK